MKFDEKDRELIKYYNSLSPNIKNQIDNTNAYVSTLGELMLIAEHYNQKEEEPNEFK